ncbi:arginine--tRNA ligase [Candidatus Pacearchaeota archaeon]|nr:arginine--tRNA ligase [Candidatus Pacearchaeota archaeon]
MYKEKLIPLLVKITRFKENQISDLIEIPPSMELGDYSFPCFILSKREKKSPIEIAKSFAIKLKKILPKEFEDVVNKGPYLNFFINKKVLAKYIIKINSNFGKTNLGKKKTILIDYSAPNIGKPLHIGHIRGTIIGDSLMRIYDFLGYNPVGLNYLGDVGLHIGKLIVAYELWLNKDALKKDPVNELLRLYVKFCSKEKSKVQMETEEELVDNEWTNKAKEKIKLFELGDKKTIKVWKSIYKSSMKGFNKVYDTLKVSFHDYTGQGQYETKGKEIVIEALKKGIAKQVDDGGIYFHPLKDNLEKKKFILRNNKTASYITYDIGAAYERNKKYNFKKIIYITDLRQMEHFQSLFSFLKNMDYDFAKCMTHIPHGTLRFGNEIMATREGKVILLEDVLNKAIEKAKSEIKKRKTKGDPEIVGVGAIKYIVLNSSPQRDINFTWNQALSFEGNSGPYLQYSFARATSIIKKAKNFNKGDTKINLKNYKFTTEELTLIKKISDFPQIIIKAESDLNPAIIANYSFQLAQIFNEFYHACPVLKTNEEAFRLRLIDSFRTTLSNSLHLLGIEVMDEM